MKKFFSIHELDIGTFFGGPLLGFYILSQNYKKLGKDKMAANFIGYGFIFLIILLLLSMFVPVIQKGGILIMVALIFILRGYYKKHQLPEINKIPKEKRTVESGWKVFGLILLSTLITIVIAIGLGFALSSLGIV